MGRLRSSAVGAILAAVFWPDAITCVARCNEANNIFDQNGPVFVVDSHIGLRILVAVAGLALGAVIAAMSFSKERVNP